MTISPEEWLFADYLGMCRLIGIRIGISIFGNRYQHR